MTLVQLRKIFAILEQQRATRDAVENLGRPDESRANLLLAAKSEKQSNVIDQNVSIQKK